MPELQGAQFADLYHGTRPGNVAGIRERGLIPPGGTGPGWPMLTTSRDQAHRYAPSGDATVLHFRVPKSEIWSRGHTGDPALWPGKPHDVYGHAATAHALRKPLSSKYIVED